MVRVKVQVRVGVGVGVGVRVEGRSRRVGLGWVASAPESLKYSSSTSKASHSLASEGTNLVRVRVRGWGQG